MKIVALVVITIVSVLRAPSQRPNYDPVARKPAAQSGGFLDSSLGLVNPKNTDYGCEIDAKRQFLVEQTLKNLDFWVIGITGSLLIVSFFMLLHQSRERDRREIIAADLLAQYHNAWVDAHSHANAAIRGYNELVNRTNGAAESERRAVSRQTEPTHSKPEETSSSGAARPLRQSPASNGGAGGTSNRDNKSEPSQGAHDVEIDSIAQISVLQKQLEASCERETNLKKQLAAAERRCRRLESNGSAVSGETTAHARKEPAGNE